MLSMSSDTIESYGSREITHVDYGYSRSSTPDSSASSRLAAQLERSAYRRSRSKTRRKQNSKQNDEGSVNVASRKPSRNKRLKYQQRSHSYEPDDFRTSASRMNGVENSSTRRSLISDEEQAVGTTPMAMRKTTSTEQYSKQRRCDEHEDRKILTAQPVSALYTVSCVSNGHDDYRPKVEIPSRHSDSATDSQGRRAQTRMNVKQNGKNRQSPDKANVFLSSSRKVLPETQHMYEGQNNHKKNRSVNVSRVRFEESWDDTPGKKPDYKVREASGMSISLREELPGQKRSETQRLLKSDETNNVESKENNDIKLNTSCKIERALNDKQGKASLNTQPIVQDKPAGTKKNEHKDSMMKDNITIKRDVPSRLDIGISQGRSEVSRNDESKPLGLRQLIKIHEIQIAEVAKSAASMKRPMPDKAHEGRLVKVKIVPEIETKQSCVKQNAAKVTFAGNKSSLHGANVLPRKIPEVRSNVVEPVNGEEGINLKNDTSVLKVRGAVKPKRHTVELRTKSHNQEDQKWKRHTAIGLVGFDHQEHEVPHGDWSPTEKGSKMFFTSDSDAEVEYLKKQPVEPEKHFIDERIQKSDVTDLKKSPSLSKEMNELWKDSGKAKNMLENDPEMNEIPPERPPLPENFYCSTEEILVRPPPPIYNNDFENVGCKSKVDYIPKLDFKPSVEYIKASPLSEPLCPIPLSSSLPAIHVSTAIVKGDDVNLPEQEIIQEKDHVLGKTRTTREMYEERLARINLVPLDITERHLANQEMVASLCSSLESFNWDTSCNLHNLNKSEYMDKLKTCTKQMKVLTKQKEDLEKNFELERRDWKRKYEEQQKVANAYQKLEDRYRRQVQELQEALKLCRCTDMETRKSLFLGQAWKRKDPYVLTTQTQSILDETEEWLKAQSTRSDITYNSENISNVRIPNGHSPRDSLTDIIGLGTKWAMDYKDIVLATGIDQDNGTSV